MRKVRIEAPRGDIVDRNSRHARAHEEGRGRPDRPVDSCPRACARTPTTTARQLAAAENERLEYAAPVRRVRRASSSDDGRKDDQGREARAARALQAGQARRARAGRRSRAIPADEPELDRALPPHRRGRSDIRPKTIHERVIRGIADAPYSNVTIRTDVPLAQFNYMRERAGVLRGRRGHQALPARVPATASSPRSCSARSPRSAPKQLKQRRVQGRRAGHADRPERARVRSTTSTCAATDGSTRARRRRVRRAATSSARLSVTRAQAGPAAEAHARLRPAEGRRRARSRRRSATPSTTTRAGAFVAMDPRDGAILAMGSAPAFDASVFARAVHAAAPTTP